MKKILSMVLTLLLVLGLFAVPAAAEVVQAPEPVLLVEDFESYESGTVLHNGNLKTGETAVLKFAGAGDTSKVTLEGVDMDPYNRVNINNTNADEPGVTGGKAKVTVEEFAGNKVAKLTSYDNFPVGVGTVPYDWAIWRK